MVLRDSGEEEPFPESFVKQTSVVLLPKHDACSFGGWQLPRFSAWIAAFRAIPLEELESRDSD